MEIQCNVRTESGNQACILFWSCARILSEFVQKMEIAQASPHPCCGLKNVGHWWSAQSKIRRLRSCPKMYTIFSMRAISKTSYETWSEKTKPERGGFTEAKTSPEKTSRTVPRIAVFAGLLADPAWDRPTTYATVTSPSVSSKTLHHQVGASRLFLCSFSQDVSRIFDDIDGREQAILLPKMWIYVADCLYRQTTVTDT